MCIISKYHLIKQHKELIYRSVYLLSTDFQLKIVKMLLESVAR